MENIKNYWNNIETLIKTILPEYADKKLFEDGATEEEIKRLEDIVGTTLPADFRESLKIHNGQVLKKFILHDGRDAITLLNIEQIKSNLKDVNNFNQEMENAGYSSPKVEGIPVFEFPSGEYTLLNLQTGELGFLSHDDSAGVGFKSFAGFLKKTADRLDSGRYKGDDGFLKTLYIKDAWNLIDSISGMEKVLFPESDSYELGQGFKKLDPKFRVGRTNEHFRVSYTQCHDGQKRNKLWFFDGVESYAFLSSKKMFENFQPISVNEAILVPIFANQTSVIYMDITEDKYNTSSLYKKQKDSDKLELLEDDLIDILLKTYAKLKKECGIDPKYQLLNACRDGDFELVKEFVAQKANINAINKLGESPLYLALKQIHKEIAIFLIENNADINIVLAVEGRIAEPLIMIVLSEAFTYNTSNKDFYIEMAKIIIQHKDFNPDITNDNGYSAIFETKKNIELSKLLIAKGANVNLADSRNETPLFSACEFGSYESVKLLVDNGANVNIAKTDSTMPIHKAVKNTDYMKIVKLLIEKGAGINAKGDFDNTPLLIALDSFKEDLAILLIKKGADVYAKNKYNRTAMHFAVDKGYLKVVQQLVDKGAEINPKDNGGATPLFLAMDRKRKQVVDFLKSKGAE